MTLTLSAKEQKMLAVVLREMPAMPAVDFEKVAQKVGIAHARNARSAFKKIWEKLKASDNEVITDQAEDDATKPNTNKAKNTRKRSLPKKDDSSDEEAEQAIPKKKAKAATRKAGGQRKADKKKPAKLARTAAVKEDISKEESADGGEAPELSMGEAEEFFDQADDDCSEYKDPDETEDDPDLPPEEEDGNPQVNGSGISVDVVHQDHDNDMTYAEMLGLSIEQYRQYAREAEWGEHNAGASEIPPPTTGAHYSDEEEA